MKTKRSLLILTTVTAVMWSAVSVSAVGISGRFTDDDKSIHESAIETIAAAGITSGCNPPASDQFCPQDGLTRGELAAFLHRAFNAILTPSGNATFIDDNDSIFESDIEWLARTGVTRGCNPPANNHFCPDATVTREQMAAFLTRALDLPTASGNRFTDDNDSLFEDEIEAIAQAGITAGCNPPANTKYCPGSVVTRAQMASFLVRALDLDLVIPRFTLHSGWWCRKDGTVCSGSATSVGGRRLVITEGWDQALPATAGEMNEFNQGDTYFQLRVNGNIQTMSQDSSSSSTRLSREWETQITVPNTGSMTIDARWYWDGVLIRRTVVTVTASG